METVRAGKHMAKWRQKQMETTGIFLNSENKTWDKRREKVSMTERKGKGGGGSQQTVYAHSLTRQTEWESEREGGREREREPLSFVPDSTREHTIPGTRILAGNGECTGTKKLRRINITCHLLVFLTHLSSTVTFYFAFSEENFFRASSENTYI